MSVPRSLGVPARCVQMFVSCIPLVAGLAAAGAPHSVQARSAEQSTTVRVFLPAALKSAGFAGGPGPWATATPESGPTATPVAATQVLLLNEVSFKPPIDRPAFLEITNAGSEPAGLEGVRITNGLSETFMLPSGLPPLEASAFALVLFDGQDRVETWGAGLRIHADRIRFLAADRDALVLEGEGGMRLDHVAWGRAHRDAVRLGSGGVMLPVAPGSTIGRAPYAASRGSGARWAFYGPADESPGAENSMPAVDAFPMLDGIITAPGSVDLAWYPRIGAVGYRLHLADNEAFDPLLTEATVASARFSTPVLPPGEYVWRVQAVGPGGETSRFSRPMHLSVEIAEPSIHMASEVTLAVPMYKQRKDTAMLLISRPATNRGAYAVVAETGPHGWDASHPDLDPNDPADAMNCGLAVISMTAAYYGGGSSQDRIGYELFHSRTAGPEDDLNWGDGVFDHEFVELLNWAVGPGVVAYWNPGEDGDFGSPPSDRERETFVESVRLALDSGQPVPVCGDGHCVVIYGYADSLLGLRLHVNDPWTGQRVIRASRLPATMYAIPPVAATGRVDEIGVAADSDGDRVVDFDEVERFKTLPGNVDSDGDELNDKNEIKLSMFDDDHGLAVNKDGRDDLDGDGKAPELDADTDDGGCVDGLEDLSLNGSISPDLEETSPFEPEDDRCISGKFRLVSNSDSVTEHQIVHTEILHEVAISMKPMEDGTVEGSGVSDYFAYTVNISIGRCVTYTGPFELSWPVTITGRFVDEVLSFEVDPSSQTIIVTPTGTCGGDPFPYVVPHFVGWAEITFDDGVYEYSADTPHIPPDTGNTHVELKLEQRIEHD